MPCRKLSLSGSGELLRNFALLAISGFGTQALSFFVTILLARRLGAGGFGKVNFAQAFTAYFLLLADFGLSLLGIRELATHREEVVHRLGVFFGARLLTSVGAAALLCGATIFLPRPWQDKILILLFTLNLLGSTLALDWVYQALERMDLVAIGNIIRSLVALGLVWLFVHVESHILLVPVFLALGALGRMAFHWYRFVRAYDWPKVAFARLEIIDLLRRASALGVSHVMIQVYYNSDTLLLGFFRSDLEIGWYNAAYRLVLVFSTLAGTIGNVIFPRLSRLSQVGDAAQNGPIMILGAKLLLYLALPVALGGTFFSGQIIAFLYGSAYASSGTVLRIIVWQIFTVFANVSFAYYLLAMKKQRLYLYSVTVGAIVNLLLNLFLIPSYGIIGASVATVAAEVAVLGMLYQYAYRFIAPAPMVVPILKAVLAGAAFAIMALVVDNLWLGLVLATLAYAVALLSTVPFTREEVRRLLPWRVS